MQTISGKRKWIDIERPTDRDLKWIKKKRGFHPIILSELKEPSARAKIERYDHYLYLVYHFPIYNKKEKVSERSEVDFLITPKEVITVHYGKIEALDELKKTLAKDKQHLARTCSSTLLLTCGIIEALLSFHRRQLRHVQEKVEKISTSLFKDREKFVLTNISYVKRDISEFRIIIRPQGHLLHSLADAAIRFWGENSRIYINDLIGEHLKVVGQLDDFREAVSDFEDTNNQLMNIKAADVMKTFTALSFLTFPFMLIAAIFGMKTKGTPLVDNPEGFWIVIGVMIAGMASMFAYFKKKHWL